MNKKLVLRFCVGLAAMLALAMPAFAQETVCASVKIQIKQQLTLERQAFDAEMKINNTTDSGVISNVSVVVKVMEENGTPVPVTEDPNASGAKFFIPRLQQAEHFRRYRHRHHQPGHLRRHQLADHPGPRLGGPHTRGQEVPRGRHAQVPLRR
jgi:hypothetical protein